MAQGLNQYRAVTTTLSAAAAFVTNFVCGADGDEVCPFGGLDV